MYGINIEIGSGFYFSEMKGWLCPQINLRRIHY